MALAGIALVILVVATDHDVSGVVSADAGRTADPAAGAKVFASAGCTACHTFGPAGATGKVGPNLDKLSLSAEAAALVITNGRKVMPSFKGRLSATQISNVVAYLLAGKMSGSKPPPAIGARGVLAVRVMDVKLVLTPTIVPPGKVTLRARNAGKLRHTLVVLRAEPSPRLVTAFRVIRPGETLSRVLKLGVGSYLVSSDRRGRVHGSMLALLRVRSAVSSVTPTPDPGAATPGPVPGGGASGGTGGAAGDATNGARLFAALGCGGCHTFASAGSTGTVGPNLGVTRPSAARVVAIVTSGSGVMPSFAARASAKEILDIAAFITSANGGGGAGGGGGTATPASTGAQIFASAGCGGCHTLVASGASGTVGPNLDVLRPSLNQVIAMVTAGGGVMPAFGGRLTATQIRDVAAYVSSVAGTTGGSVGGSTPTASPGLLLFQRGGCGGCHTLAAAGSTGTRGPDLDDKHPDAGKVVETVTRGKDSMPSFITVFSAAEIRELANWVASVVQRR